MKTNICLIFLFLSLLISHVYSEKELSLKRNTASHEAQVQALTKKMKDKKQQLEESFKILSKEVALIENQINNLDFYLDGYCKKQRLTPDPNIKKILNNLSDLKNLMFNSRYEINELGEKIETLNETIYEQSIHEQNSDDHSPHEQCLFMSDHGCHIPIIEKEGSTFAVKIQDDGSKLYYQLNKGDHNLWYGDNDKLWGFDKFGRIFSLEGCDCREVWGNIKCPETQE